MHWLGCEIIRTSKDSTSRSVDSDGSTPQLTTDFPEDTTGRLDRCDGSASQLTSRNAKKPIRGPSDLNKVPPSLADINIITKPSKDADHPVNVTVMEATNRKRLVAEDSDEEGNYFCYKIGSLIVESRNVISEAKKEAQHKGTFEFFCWGCEGGLC